MIPKIDPQVKHVGVSYLRKINATTLRDLAGALVVCENSQPLAVIVSYETFLRIQKTHAVLSEGVDRAVSMLDATGPPLAQGRGKVSTVRRGPQKGERLRSKGDTKR